MVGVLIEMRAATMRRQTTGKYALGVLLLALFVMLLAAGTLAAASSITITRARAPTSSPLSASAGWSAG